MAELRTPQGHTLLLPEGCVSIGADPSNDVPVAAHLGLAPVHFRLQPWEGGHFLEDAGSGLGTLVNGHPVNWKPLTHGDSIMAGELEVVYRQQSEVGFSPVPVPVAPIPQPTPLAPAAVSTLPAGIPAILASAPPLSAVLPTYAGLALLPSSPTINTALALSGSGVPCPTPPAWLPSDLLPESYQLPLTGTSQHRAGDITGNIEPTSPPAPNLPTRPRSIRRLLTAAALCALLGWAGYLGWQRGHFAPLLQSVRGHTHDNALQPSTAVQPQSKTPDTTGSLQNNSSNPLNTSPAPAARPSASPAAPAPIPQIATQLGH